MGARWRLPRNTANRHSSGNPEVAGILAPVERTKAAQELMETKFTDRFAQTAILPASGRAVHAHMGAPGLELCISVDGRRAWSIRYAPKGRSQRRATYGTHPTISLAEAGARALETAAAAADGIDLPARAAANREQPRNLEIRPQTAGAILDETTARHCKPAQRRPALARRMSAMHVKPANGSTPLSGLPRRSGRALGQSA